MAASSLHVHWGAERIVVQARQFGEAIWGVANMRRLGMLVAIGSLLVASLAGCAQGLVPVPAGAQLVHLVATDVVVHLSPATVRAGDVYVELDEPLPGSFMFVEAKKTADAVPGPLNDDDLARLAIGDTEGTAISGFGPSCAPAPGADARGKLAGPGNCGNVWKFTLVAGKYAILGPAWTEQLTEASVKPTAGAGGFVAPPTLAVLVVLP
jgi:hypothetical protein